MPKVKKIYKGNVQVWPDNGWKPGANTLAYYKFNGNLNDSSGNGHNLGMASGSFSYSTASGGGKYVQTNTSAWTNTINLPISSGMNITISFFANSDYVTNRYLCCFLDVGNTGIARCNNDNGNINLGGVSVGNTRGQRDYYTITGSNNSYKIYKNGAQISTCSQTFQNQTTLRLNSVGYTSNYYGYGAYSSAIKMGELIIENKARTAQEISDYYNSTKSNYGL